MPVDFIDSPSAVTPPPGPPGPAPRGFPAYPTGNDLCEFLLGTGIAMPEEQDLDAAAEAGAAAFEAITDRLPMLAAQQVRKYDFGSVNDRGVLDLSADLLQVTSLTMQGTLLTEGTQFFLRPNDAPMRRRPFNRIQFPQPYAFYAQGPMLPQTYYQAIVIDGLWGYATLIPSDAFRAMLRLGALELIFGSVNAGDGRGPIPAFVRAWEAVSRTTESYDPDFLWKQRKDWQAYADMTTTRYRRVGVG